MAGVVVLFLVVSRSEWVNSCVVGVVVLFWVSLGPSGLRVVWLG